VEADSDGCEMADLGSGGYCTTSAGITCSLERHEDCGGHEIRWIHEGHDGKLKDTEGV